MFYKYFCPVLCKNVFTVFVHPVCTCSNKRNVESSSHRSSSVSAKRSQNEDSDNDGKSQSSSFITAVIVHTDEDKVYTAAIRRGSVDAKARNQSRFCKEF